jgi:hypothetical protein
MSELLSSFSHAGDVQEIRAVLHAIVKGTHMHPNFSLKTLSTPQSNTNYRLLELAWARKAAGEQCCLLNTWALCVN